MLASYCGLNWLPLGYKADIRSFEEAFRKLLAAVPADRMAVASIPPLGDGMPGGDGAEVIAEYNAKVRELVKESPRAVYVPLWETLGDSDGMESFDASFSSFAGTIA